MKTEQLIDALAIDAATPQPSGARRAAVAVTGATLAAGCAFLLFLGPRPDFTAPEILAATAAKLLVTLALAACGLAVSMRLARPEPTRPWEIALLALPALLLAALVAYSLWRNGLAGWEAKMIGKNGLRCALTIPALGLAPMCGVLLVLARGAVTQHLRAGIAAGFAAAGVAASLYALYCTDDSPLFMALWYSLSLAALTVVGVVATRRVVRM